MKARVAKASETRRKSHATAPARRTPASRPSTNKPRPPAVARPIAKRRSAVVSKPMRATVRKPAQTTVGRPVRVTVRKPPARAVTRRSTKSPATRATRPRASLARSPARTQIGILTRRRPVVAQVPASVGVAPVVKPAEPAGPAACPHHWQIPSPNGPTSIGTCKNCGETREFRNSIPGGGWEREASEARKARAAAARAQSAAAAVQVARTRR